MLRIRYTGTLRNITQKIDRVPSDFERVLISLLSGMAKIPCKKNVAPVIQPFFRQVIFEFEPQITSSPTIVKWIKMEV